MGEDAADASADKAADKAADKPADENSTAARPAGAAAALPPVTVPPPDTGYTPAGVPTLEGVREKIETRYGTALGATELAQDTPDGHAAAQRYEARQQAAADKLEEIRESMHRDD